MLVHEPQVYLAGAVRQSSMQELLRSEAYSEWAHPGEAEALKAHRLAEAEEIRKEREAERARLQRAREAELAQNQRAREAEARKLRRLELAASARDVAQQPGEVNPPETDEPVAQNEAPSPLPEWIRAGLACVGCSQRTTDWQNADPGKGRCVCKACFAKGVRLAD